MKILYLILARKGSKRLKKQELIKNTEKNTYRINNQFRKKNCSKK